MLPENFKHYPRWEIDPDIPVQEGAEKNVFCFVIDGRRYAAKLYRDDDDFGEPIDKAARAEQEFYSHQEIRTSSLKPYVPKPKQLIHDHSHNPIGLLVEWRDGKILGDNYGSVRVPRQSVLNLQQELLRLTEYFWLDSDSFSAYNLGWDGQRLWMAEPKLAIYTNHDLWQKTVIYILKDVLDNYCR